LTACSSGPDPLQTVHLTASSILIKFTKKSLFLLLAVLNNFPAEFKGKEAIRKDISARINSFIFF
jgi:hypothetical protein